MQFLAYLKCRCLVSYVQQIQKLNKDLSTFTLYLIIYLGGIQYIILKIKTHNWNVSKYP